jgi:bifunctional non-homologous end joining protein LigD
MVDPEGDEICPCCGFQCNSDESLRCAGCDARSCIDCLPCDPDPICADCLPADFPRRIEPMLARPSGIPEPQEEWNFELKWDGVRAICYIDGPRIRIQSRNAVDITARYPEFSDLPGKLTEERLILDGEIVALDRDGRPSFSRLQQRMHASAEQAKRIQRKVPVQYFIFDILFVGDRSLIEAPYRERREILDRVGLAHPRVRIPRSYTGGGEEILSAARAHGLEGIVCKLSNSAYEPGRRSPSWRKVKIVKTQDLVIGGWTPQENAQRIGSLLLGRYTPDARLEYVGNVGSGFSDFEHQILLPKLKALEIGQNPFDAAVPKKNVRFVSPALVAEVEYRRWPEGGKIQQAAYKGLRSDKRADETMPEKEV